MRDVAGYNQCTSETEACADGVLAELGQHVCHWLVDVHVDDLTTKVTLLDLGEIFVGVRLQLLQENSVFCDLTENLERN